MSDVERLFAKPIVKNIGGLDFKFEAKPMEEISEIIALDEGNAEERIAKIKAMIFDVIKGNYPDVTDEELKKIPLTHFKAFKSGIEEVNGLGVPDGDEGQNKKA